jgi:hypothetical protein
MRHAISLAPCKTNLKQVALPPLGKRKSKLKMLTRNFKKTVMARVERDSAFAEALLDEAAHLFLSKESETARVILRDLVNARLGFEARREN